MTDWKITLASLLCPSIFEERNNYYKQSEEFRTKWQEAEKVIISTQKDFTKLIVEHKLLIDEVTALKQKGSSPIDLYCSKQWKTCPDLIYEQKRKWQGHPIAVRLNNLIVPQFEVQKVIYKIKPTGTRYDHIKRLGDWSAGTFTWTDDKTIDASGDFYLYPEEIIVSKKGDCEDHSYANASFNPDLVAVGYGYFIPESGKKYGHAWNLFVWEDQLYILETTGNKAEISKYPNPKYDLYYVITKDTTYKVKDGVKFGTIAKWD